jgi:hypothetical protein
MFPMLTMLGAMAAMAKREEELLERMRAKKKQPAPARSLSMSKELRSILF